LCQRFSSPLIWQWCSAKLYNITALMVCNNATYYICNTVHSKANQTIRWKVIGTLLAYCGYLLLLARGWNNLCWGTNVNTVFCLLIKVYFFLLHNIPRLNACKLSSWFCVMCHHVVWLVGTDVLQEPAAASSG